SGHCATDRFRAAFMASRARQPARHGPTAIAVHDDRDVIWRCSRWQSGHGGSEPEHGSGRWRTASDLQNFLFLLGEDLIDLFDMKIGHLLDLLIPVVMLVFGNFVRFLLAFVHVHAISSHVTYGNARLLGIFMRNLGQLLPTLLAQLRDWHAHELSLRARIEPQPSIAN